MTGDPDVRVRAVEQGAERPRVPPPRRVEQPPARAIAQFIHRSELDVLELVDDQQD